MQDSSFNKRSVLAVGAVVAIAAMAAGCGPRYEIDRPGTWRPTGANAYNLQSMIADSRDLSAGEAASTERGNAASRAVTRLYNEKRRALLNVSLSKIAPAQDSPDSGGGGGATGGSGGGAGAQ